MDEETTTRCDQERRFCGSLNRLNWEMHKHSMDALELIDLTMPQLIVLIKLHDLGGSATMCELVDRTLQSGPTLTRIVDRMVAADLVRRERDEHDRRLVHIVLTEQGREKRTQATTRYEDDIACLTAHLDDDELQHLSGLMTKLLDGMERLRAAELAAEQIV